MSKIKVAAITVIKEDAVSAAVLESEIKRNGLVNRIFAFGIAGRIRVPVNKSFAAFIEPRRLFAQTIEVFVKSKFLCRRHEHPGAWVKHHPRQCSFGVISHWLLV